MGILKRLSMLAVSLVMVSLGTYGTVLSQEGSGGSGLSISPTRTELVVEPGGEKTLSLSLRNVTSNPIIAQPVINDFYSDNVSGQPQLLINDERDVPSIKPFLGELNDIRLELGQEQTVEVPVRVPEGTAPGGYYGVIRYLAVPEGAESPDAGQVSLTASVSSIVLIEVPGDIREQIQLRDIKFYRQDVEKRFFTSQPDQVGIEIVNQGNGFSKPFGSVTIVNPLNKEIQSYEINPGSPRSNVLPGSTRVFKNKIEGVSVPGRYRVEANVSFGNGGEVLSLTQHFWYIPIWFIAALIAGVGFLIYLGFLLKRRLKSNSYKHRR